MAEKMKKVDKLKNDKLHARLSIKYIQSSLVPVKVILALLLSFYVLMYDLSASWQWWLFNTVPVLFLSAFLWANTRLIRQHRRNL